MYFENRIVSLKRRKRKIATLRLVAWLKDLIRAPWSLAPFLPLCIVFAMLWKKRVGLLPNSGNLLLSTVNYYCFSLLLPLIFVLLVAGLLSLFSTPRYAKRYEDALLQIGLVSYGGEPPALISRKRIKGTSSVTQLVFYSLGVSKETWERQKNEVEDALNLHLVDTIKYGGWKGANRNLIVLTAAPGSGGNRQEPLYDEEL